MNKNKRFSLGFSVAIFGLIFIYLIVSLVIYFTTDHISSYQVKLGTLSQNSTYTAIAIRQEEVVNAPAGGYITYNTADQGRTAVNETICTINTSQTAEQAQSTEMDEEALSKVKTLAYDYTETYKASRFNTVYNLQNRLDTDQTAGDTTAAGGTAVTSTSDGIVAYYTDGYESKTADTITIDDFNYSSYKKENLRTNEMVATGSPLYKIISGETWSLVITLSDGQLNRIKDYDQIQVKFEKDGKTETGTVRKFDKDGCHFAEITFENGQVRYCDERFLDIELITNTEFGLKVPKSAVVEKEFYLVPEEYVTETGENGDLGLLLEMTNKKGEKTTQIVTDCIYDSIEISTTKESDNKAGSDVSEENLSQDQSTDAAGTNSQEDQSNAGTATTGVNDTVNTDAEDGNSTDTTANTAENKDSTESGVDTAEDADSAETNANASGDTAAADSSTDVEEENTEKYYLVEKDYVDDGDQIIASEKAERFTVGKTYKLEGVYNINKGYALFKQVNIIDENEEYCIISNDDQSDLAQYDYIIRDGSTVKEDQILR